MDTPESSITTFINQIIDVSPPVALALVLTLIYTIAARIPNVVKWHLDFGVIGAAAVVYPLLADPGKVGFGVRSPVAAEVVTGLLIGCAASVGNPAFRRMLAKFGLGGDNGKGDTTTFTKADVDNASAISVTPTSPTTPPTSLPKP